MNNTKKFSELTPEELRMREREIREEAFKLRLQKQQGLLEKPSMLRTHRRNIARLKTYMKKK